MHSKSILEAKALKICSVGFHVCLMCAHLNFWGGQRFPVVGFELVEFVKLQANVLDGQLEHVPETRQILGDGSRVCIWILTYTHEHKHADKYCLYAWLLTALIIGFSTGTYLKEAAFIRHLAPYCNKWKMGCFTVCSLTTTIPLVFLQARTKKLFFLIFQF